MFSVIIPLYNKEDDVAQTLDSLLNQEFRDFEIIIVNDGSTDNSVEVLEQYNDPRIRIFHTENRGLSAARNTGVEHSNYKYLTFLDADDTWESNHLLILKYLIDIYPDYSWYGTSYSIINKNNKETPCIQYKSRKTGWQGIIRNFFLINRTQWIIHISTICVTKDLFEAIGKFDEKITCEEDIDFYIRLALKTPLVYANNITMKYNMLGSNRISDSNFKDKKGANLSKYKEEEKENEDLKKFLDFFRYTQYIKFTLATDYKKASIAKKDLCKSNLTLTQQILIHMPRLILILGSRIKEILMNFGINIRVSNVKDI